jgi:hypothetical protein
VTAGDLGWSALIMTALQPIARRTNDPDPVAPTPIIPKAYKIPFPDISMRYGKAVILRMEMLARRR